MEKIAVAVRFRPSSGDDPPSARYWKVEDNSITLHRPLGTPISGVSFIFDRVFDQSCKNITVYNALTKSIIDAAVNGFNGTSFAYGQTSSGKTYTMNGSDDDPGIIQLAVHDVFRCIETIKEREFLVRVSYMEIYNEEINDLLSVENQKLQIHESLDRGVFVAGLREEIVDTAEQVSKLLILGEANRHFGETNMNIRSSRSHTIFRMVIESKVKEIQKSSDFPGADSIRVSVLNLVDLAGSERIAKTGADGVRLKEGKHINKSLMTLGNVINKLSEGGKLRSHIPYRDSKLTRILQPALGGNAKTSIICTLAPEELHIEETRGTLQFASRAKRITNCAQVNEILTDAALLKRQKLEIEELRRKLQGSHSEVLEQVILKQRNDMLKFELERDKLAMQLEEERSARQELENRLKDQQLKIDSLNQDNGASFLEDSNSRTPNVGMLPSEFIARRPNYSVASDSSPLPETLGDKADEDTWLQLNKGFSTDLNMLEMTPTLDPQLPFLPKEKALEERCELLERECSRMREENSSLTQALACSKEEVREELAAEMRSYGQLLSKRRGLLRSLYARSQGYVSHFL